ncbi:MAG: amino acid adenylation domain-containing protein, partial [Oscillospiraceae bacterium]|nr:amino acid adenylation domain-containing protein [Oscillospiraceae bacterium]
SGGAYLPIDPDYPDERIEFMLQDSGAKILLTQSWLSDKVKSYDINTLYLDKDSSYSEDDRKLEHINNSSDLAYCIYTSGSTGTPKGVLIEHRSVVNLIVAQSKVYGINIHDNILQFYSISFDPSLWLIQLSLLNGATLHIINNNLLLDSVMFDNYLIRENITLLSVVPSFYYKLDLKKVDSLLRVVLGGEVCSVDSFQRLDERTKLYNVYGPTEATVVSSLYILNRADVKSNIPIGKPIANYMMYIMNCIGGLQPVGVAGELCISGIGLARGYLNRHELTAEKFVDNPFVPGERMYRTGDMAKWQPDGNIEFIGRIDDQVKIRGYRIELGEVESALLKNGHIIEAVVLAKDDIDGTKSLSAYIVADMELTILELRSYLSSILPEYMIPSYFTQIERLPITPNGKVDRKALLAIETRMETGVEHEAPSNEVEEKLCEIWKMLLNIDTLSVNDNFFDLGGQSLKAVVLASRINQAFDVELNLSEVFMNPTVKTMARLIIGDGVTECGLERNIVKLSDGDDGYIFAFPPAFGYGVAYNELSKALSNYTLFGFDYIEDSSVQEYVEIIKRTRQSGSFTLLAYSAGGKLAFEVARRLEQANYEINSLILIDSDLEDKLDEDDFIQTARIYLQEKFNSDLNVTNKKMLAEITSKNKDYAKLLNEIEVSKPINARINLILSEDGYRSCNYLDGLTFTEAKTWEGRGQHIDMISGDALVYNASIIKKILNEQEAWIV